jgi:DNA repair ATPase RecN
MEKMLKAMLNVQKEIALEEDALLVDLWNIAGALQEATEILHDLISKGNFEEAKGFLNDCSQLQQKQEHFEALLADMRSDYDTLENMIKEAKRLVSKYEIDDTKCEEEEETFSPEDFLVAAGFFSMK